MRIFMRLLIALPCLLLLAAPAHAQVSAPPPLPEASTPSRNGDHGGFEADAEREAERQALKSANLKRQEDIKRDTDKLLQLATELKLYVDKTNENIISLSVIRKAEEIEKLSKEVQKKMRTQ